MRSEVDLAGVDVEIKLKMTPMYGMIAQKLGMTRVFKEDGTHLPVTVLKVDTCGRRGAH